MNKLLDTHRTVLAAWRQTMNLVGPGDVEEHYRDSERGLAWLQPHGRWADLGSGAGFPGIVLAARFPGLQVDLVERRRKRCAFLQHVLGEAGVDPGHVRVRCVDVAALPGGAYDGIVARAFAPPEQVAALAERLLNDKGIAVLFVQEHQEVHPPPGMHVFHVEHYEVAGKRRKTVGLGKVP